MAAGEAPAQQDNGRNLHWVSRKRCYDLSGGSSSVADAIADKYITKLVRIGLDYIIFGGERIRYTFPSTALRQTKTYANTFKNSCGVKVK